MNIDALFEGMAKADTSGRGGHMHPGVYVVRTKNILVKEGRNPKKPGNSFIVEFEIVETCDAEKHKIGSSGSWVQKVTWPAFFGNVTKFVYACLATTDPDAWAQTKENLGDPEKRVLAEVYARAMCGSDAAKRELGSEWEEGVFLGLDLRLETALEKTSTGGDFTAYKWGPAPLR